MKGNFSGACRIRMRLMTMTLVLLCGMPLVQPQPVAQPASSLVHTTSTLFEFHSAFWLFPPCAVRAGPRPHADAR